MKYIAKHCSNLGLMLLLVGACQRAPLDTKSEAPPSSSNLASEDVKTCTDEEEESHEAALVTKPPVTIKFTKGALYCNAKFEWAPAKAKWVVTAKDGGGSGGCPDPDVTALINSCSDPYNCPRTVQTGGSPSPSPSPAPSPAPNPAPNPSPAPAPSPSPSPAPSSGSDDGGSGEISGSSDVTSEAEEGDSSSLGNAKTSKDTKKSNCKPKSAEE